MMDTTPRYIKMCEKAEEIQEQWPLDKERHKAIHSSSRVSGVTIVLADWFYVKDDYLEWFNGGVWLPRQDQLQEMVKRIDVATSVAALTLWFPVCPVDIYLGQSMEQLWLAFVMHEKYGKVWDDEKGEWHCPTNADILGGQKEA